MPSIEILAIRQAQPRDFHDLPFAVTVDTTLRSHRSPSRFQQDFDLLSGSLYHLGNPNLKADSQGRCFFAYQLLSRDSQRDATFLEFGSPYTTHVQTLLAELMGRSPAHRLIFTSDWQFGPEWAKRYAEITLRQFWRLHDSRQLMLNTLYPIRD